MVGFRAARAWVQDPLALAVQIAHDPAVVVDLAGRIVVFNERLGALAGYEHEGLVGQPLRLLFPDQDLPDPRLGFVPASRGPAGRADGAAETVPARLTRRDGTTLAVSLTTTPVCTPEHGPVSVVSVRTARQLTLEEIGLRSLLESAPDATLILDSRCRVVLGNHRAARIFGRIRSGLPELPMEALMGEEAAARLKPWLWDRYEEILAGHDDGWTTPFTLTVARPDGTRTPVEVAVTALVLDEGALMRAAVRDVSQRLALQAAADRMKVNFLATVSHELRTPLTSILGYAELLDDLGPDELGETGRHFVEVVSRNARREIRLVDDLLTLVDIGEGRMGVRDGVVDVPKLVVEAVEEVLPAARSAGLALVIDVGRARLRVRGDEDRLGQALNNVLANAVKFAPAPGGKVAVRVRSDGDTVHVVVSDNGPGVPVEDRERVFERFYRGEDAVGQEKPGAGLGLSIVRAILDAHGGSVTVTSGPDGGAAVDLALPRAGDDLAAAAGRVGGASAYG